MTLNCFIPLNLEKDPLKDSQRIFAENENSVFSVIDLSEIKDSVIDAISSLGVKIEHAVIWNWILLEAELKRPHTDGNYAGPARRKSGINWPLSGDSVLDFWEVDKVPATPEYQTTSITHYTFWNIVGEPTCTWSSKTPALVNPQIPHRVRSLNNAIRRRSVVIALDHDLDYQDISKKLSRIHLLNSD